MTMWAVEYTYDDNAERRDHVRPAHRQYLSGLVDTGQMMAFGRYDDNEAPGALLIISAASRAEVEELISGDPFVKEGLVPVHRVRQWVGTWGAI